MRATSSEPAIGASMRAADQPPITSGSPAAIVRSRSRHPPDVGSLPIPPRGALVRVVQSRAATVMGELRMPPADKASADCQS